MTPHPPQMPISSDDLTSRGNLNLALKFIPAGSEGERCPRALEGGVSGMAGCP